MATLTGQTIADSYEQLLSLPNGGGDTTTPVAVTDGDAGTTFAMQLSTTSIVIDNATTSSATQGGLLRLQSDDGAVMASGHRLGAIEFGGAEDTSNTITTGARIEALADATWSASENGADLVIYTTDGNAAQAENMRIYSDSTSGVQIQNTTTSSATEGGKLRLTADDGAVMASGHRLGAIEFAGAEDTSNTITVGARIEVLTDATWSASENGADMVFYTTDADASQSEILRLTGTGSAVGIGQPAPASPNSIARFLHIGSSSDAHSSIVLEDNANTWELLSNDSFSIMDGTTEYVTILNTGNVGLSDSDPSEARLSLGSVDAGDYGIKIVNANATSGIFIDMNSTGGGSAIEIDSETTTGVCIFVDTPGTTTVPVLKISDCNALTTGQAAHFQSNADRDSGYPLVEITDDNGSNDGYSLKLRNDGGGDYLKCYNEANVHFRIGINGTTMIGDTANAGMTVGLTINQGANDDEAFAIKSSDVAHGRTGAAETDTYFKINKRGATFGGAQISAIGEATGEVMNMQFNSKGGAADTTKSASARGLVEFEIAQHDGSNNDANIAANGNVFNVIAYVGGAFRSLFMVDEDGDVYADGGTSTDAVTVWDEYDDSQLIRTLDLSRNNAVGLVKNKFDEFVEYNHEKLAELKIVGRDEDGTPNHYLNTTGMQRLHNGAIWQQYTEMQKMKELMYDTMVEMLGKEKADDKLKDHDIKLLDNKTLLN
jgi:hypothetical protein